MAENDPLSPRPLPKTGVTRPIANPCDRYLL